MAKPLVCTIKHAPDELLVRDHTSISLNSKELKVNAYQNAHMPKFLQFVQVSTIN